MAWSKSILCAARLFTPLAAAVILFAFSTRPAAIGANTESYHPGELLVATDEMKDPRFVESVIYLVKDDAEGTLGLVINRPLAKGPIDDLLKGMDASPKGSKLEITVHYGGPVSSRQGFLLHTDDVTLDSSIRVKGGIAMTADVQMIAAIAAGKGPQRYLFALGYAGWAPGQLKVEMERKSWFTVRADKALIFGADPENKWQRASDKRQIPL
jgi:putative transcriptional regulator